MKKHFFITGLPRMRSAWLANFLTYGKTFCHHDLFSRVDTMKDVHKAMDAGGDFDVIGMSDPALVFFWREIHEAYPNSMWIVIKRDFEETLDSCQRAFGGFDIERLEWMHRELAKLMCSLKPYSYWFDELNLNNLNDISHMCSTPIPYLRISMLMRLQVQIEPKFLMAQIQDLTNNPTPLMKDLHATLLEV